MYRLNRSIDFVETVFVNLLAAIFNTFQEEAALLDIDLQILLRKSFEHSFKVF